MKERKKSSTFRVRSLGSAGDDTSPRPESHFWAESTRFGADSAESRDDSGRDGLTVHP